MQQKIKDVLSAKGPLVHSVTRDMTVISAVDLMNHSHVGSVLVLDQGELAGIFTERDVLVRIVAAGRDPNETRVGEVMTPHVNTLTPDATIADAMKIMTEKRCRHLPVIDAGGKLLGLVSIGDMTKALTRSLKAEMHDLEAYIGGPYLA